MDKTIFKTEIVNGRCPHCNFEVILVSLASDHFRCTTCGTDLEQKINGKISYIPVMSNNQKDQIKLEIRDGQEG
jgi:ribosomal protein S27E|tara:strand:+ start:219 stop:440 length:222 start_codon:yes stop_codon:yes gene_type:complete